MSRGWGGAQGTLAEGSTSLHLPPADSPPPAIWFQIRNLREPAGTRVGAPLIRIVPLNRDGWQPYLFGTFVTSLTGG